MLVNISLLSPASNDIVVDEASPTRRCLGGAPGSERHWDDADEEDERGDSDVVTSLLFTRFAAAHREQADGRKTDEHVHDALYNLPLTEDGVDQVKLKEAHKPPVYRTNNYKYPRKLVNAAHGVTHHKKMVRSE